MFMWDLHERLAKSIQLTTDGYRIYIEALDVTFGANVDYAQIVKSFSGDIDEVRAALQARSHGDEQTSVGLRGPRPRARRDVPRRAA